MRIENLAAIITGGASGLDKVTARKLAAEGAKVALFDLNGEAGREAIEEFGGIFANVNVAETASYRPLTQRIGVPSGRHSSIA